MNESSFCIDNSERMADILENSRMKIIKLSGDLTEMTEDSYTVTFSEVIDQIHLLEGLIDD